MHGSYGCLIADTSYGILACVTGRLVWCRPAAAIAPTFNSLTLFTTGLEGHPWGDEESEESCQQRRGRNVEIKTKDGKHLGR